jgi:hypothetical protein
LRVFSRNLSVFLIQLMSPTSQSSIKCDSAAAFDRKSDVYCGLEAIESISEKNYHIGLPIWEEGLWEPKAVDINLSLGEKLPIGDIKDG